MTNVETPNLSFCEMKPMTYRYFVILFCAFVSCLKTLQYLDFNIAREFEFIFMKIHNTGFSLNVFFHLLSSLYLHNLLEFMPKSPIER